MRTAQSLFQLSRREFLGLTLAATSAITCGLAQAASRRTEAGLIDVNVNLSRWLLRRLRGDETPALAKQLRRQGVSQAWAGTFDGLLHKDLAAANARLARECRRYGQGLFLPFGSVNPKLPDWEEELRRCAEDLAMPGVRLHPNYHGYTLEDPDFARLLKLAVQRGLLVQLSVLMEDERMMHPLLRVAPVNLAPLAAVVKSTPGLRLVLLNALRTLSGKALQEIVAAGEVYVEISMLEGVGGVGNLLEQIPAKRVLFGSHAPLFYFESARLKLQESPLEQAQQRLIRKENAQRLLAQNH